MSDVTGPQPVGALDAWHLEVRQLRRTTTKPWDDLLRAAQWEQSALDLDAEGHAETAERCREKAQELYDAHLKATAPEPGARYRKRTPTEDDHD